MASCTRCTRTLPDDASVCPFCGCKIHHTSEQVHPEKDLLFRLRALLRKEQQGWRICSMILVVLVVVFLAAAGLSFLGGNVIPTILYGILALYTAVALLINILQFSRMEEFVEGIYLDCTPALERSEKNGYFLLGIFFSPLAATRFARTKAFVFSNRQELFRIMQEQDRRFESTFRSDMLHSNH